LVALLDARDAGSFDPAELEELYAAAVADTIARFEQTGSPVISDGEQRKYHNFATYCVHGQDNYEYDGGFKLRFTSHYRQWPRLTAGPFRYLDRADQHLERALRVATRPVKQAVIAPSALSLLYPQDDIPGYSRDQFLDDLLNEHVTEVRSCLRKGAHTVQIDFTEGRFAYKLDPSGTVLQEFINLNNFGLNQLTSAERARVGVHTCPGGDRDDTHSRDVDYAVLLPFLFELDATNFYVALAGERDPQRVLGLIRAHLRPGQRAFVGVIDPLNPRVETPEEVCERVLAAAEVLSVEQLGTTDDCGFSPFADDTSTSRDTAFAKIRARVEGTAMACQRLGLA